MTTRSNRRPDWKELRRFRALELKRDGWPHEEFAGALGVTKAAVSKWMKTFSEYGAAGLQARPHQGATPKLAKDVLIFLPDLLSEGATAHGFRGDLWTCARVAQVIAWEFGVSYH